MFESAKIVEICIAIVTSSKKMFFFFVLGKPFLSLRKSLN